MFAIANPGLLAAGVGVLIIGIALYRWSSRHDLQGMVVDAAWTAAMSRGKTAITPEIKAKLDAFEADPSTLSRTRQVAGMTIRHFVAQVVGIISYITMLAGLGLAAAGIWWQ